MANDKKGHSQSTPKRAYWNLKPDELYGMYSLAIVDLEAVLKAGSNLESFVDVETDSKIQIFGTDGDIESVEYLFPMNPQSHSMEETYAVSVIPLQNGGKYIEHQGNVFNNIVISGNTGLRPNTGKKSSIYRVPFVDDFNTFFGDSNDGSSIPVDEVTGFDDFIHLRNLFRAYADAKKTSGLAHKIVMVWGSIKEDDYYIVEPMSFRMNRDTKSRFTYNYEISLKTISRLDMTIMLAEVSNEPKNSFLNLLSTVRNAASRIQRGFDIVSSNLSLLQLYASSIADTFLSPMNAFFNGIASVVGSVNNLVNLPKYIISNALSGATAMFKALTSVRQTAASYAGGTIQDATGISSLVSAFRGMINDMATIAAAKDLVPIKWNKTLETLVPAKFSQGSFSNNLGPSFNPRPASPTSARQITIGSNDTLPKIAQTMLGDVGRYREIVIINDLKAPYISPNGDGRHVLRPGDTILIPSSRSDSDADAFRSSNSQDELSPVERLLGTDIKLYPYQDGGEVVYDINLGVSGDIDLISGMDNMEQAMKTLFATSRGELKVHPEYGVHLPIGSKGTLRSLTAFKLHTKAVMMRDNRIANVDQLTYKLTGNTLNIKANIKLKSLSTQFTTSVGARI